MVMPLCGSKPKWLKQIIACPNCSYHLAVQRWRVMILLTALQSADKNRLDTGFAVHGIKADY